VHKCWLLLQDQTLLNIWVGVYDVEGVVVVMGGVVGDRVVLVKWKLTSRG